MLGYCGETSSRPQDSLGRYTQLILQAIMAFVLFFVCAQRTPYAIISHRNQRSLVLPYHVVVAATLSEDSNLLSRLKEAGVNGISLSIGPMQDASIMPRAIFPPQTLSPVEIIVETACVA